MQLVIIKVYRIRFYIIICMLFHIGGSLYSTGKFSNSSDVLLVTDISCSQSDTSISQCTISHYTKTSYCDIEDIAAVRCHSRLKHNFKFSCVAKGPKYLRPSAGIAMAMDAMFVCV